MNSDSGVVTRMCGGCWTAARRSAMVVSPVRTAERRGRAGVAGLPGGGHDLGQGILEVALDVVGQRLQRGDVDDLGLVAQRAGDGLAGPGVSRQYRKAARVLPDPVGAVSRTSPPRAISGQARAWTGVGRPKRRSNQAATTGWNIRSGR